MILVDKKKASLSLKFIQRLKEKIGEGRYVQTPKELMTKLPTNKEGFMVQVGPAGSPILLNDTFYGTIIYNDKNEIDDIKFGEGPQAMTHLVHYCKSSKLEPDGITHKDMDPEYLQRYGNRNANASIILEQKDHELFFFLQYISRKVKNSLNAAANTIKDYVMEIANPEQEATTEVHGRRPALRAELLLFEDPTEGGMTEAQLDNVCRHINLPYKKYRNIDMKRKSIWSAIVGDETRRTLSGDKTVYGYQYLIELSKKKGPDYELRELVTLAIEQGLIMHDQKRKHFVYIGGPNKDVLGNICPVDDSAPSKINVLITYLKFNPEHQEKIEGLVSRNTEEEPEPELVEAEETVAPPKQVTKKPAAKKK